MRNQRYTFLAGFAALALLAGTGLASAQEPSRDHNGAPQAKAPHATPQMNKAPATGKMGQSAQKGNRNAGLHAQKSSQRAAQINPGDKTAKTNIRGNRTAQTEQRNKGAMARGEASKARQTAEQRGGKGRETTAQRDGMRGLQANASGVNVKLTDEQRTRIRSTVIEARGGPRVGNVKFDVTVGTMIPRGSIRIVPVPATLVRIEPTWRGFLYFVYQDEVVIVNPRNMRIVAVLAV
jgi:hypothetical protein